MLQPLAENAIRHGLEPLPGGGRWQSTARRDGDALVLRVSDDGRGFRAGPARPDTASGWRTRGSRLERLLPGRRLAPANRAAAAASR